MSGAKGASFNPSEAEITPGPPLFFERLRAPCACGRSFAPRRYTFFSSTLYMEGDCSHCGPVLAIFAPPVEEVQLPTPPTPEQEALVDELHALIYGNAPADPAPDVQSGTDLETRSSIVNSPTRLAS